MKLKLYFCILFAAPFLNAAQEPKRILYDGSKQHLGVAQAHLLKFAPFFPANIIPTQQGPIRIEDGQLFDIRQDLIAEGIYPKKEDALKAHLKLNQDEQKNWQSDLLKLSSEDLRKKRVFCDVYGFVPLRFMNHSVLPAAAKRLGLDGIKRVDSFPDKAAE